ncbi:MAG: lipase chaperone [Polaromonas sp.]|nr:lipase chaperone [Polaromonas sp.]
MTRRVWPAVLVASGLLALAAFWWLASGNTGETGAVDAGLLVALPGSASLLPAAAPLPLAAPQDASAPVDPFLTPEIRQTIEAMLLEALGGNEMGDAALLKKSLMALISRHFPAEFATRAGALVERYVDYRVALGKLTPPANPGEAGELRAALDARQKVREQYFTAEEDQALFGVDARLDRYTLARLEIEQNLQLTPTQKQSALKAAENELGDKQRQQRAQAVEHMAVAAQTSAFDAAGVSDADRYAQRRSQYGETAASQLAQLDREEGDWQSRLGTYAAAQVAGGRPEQLQQLRAQLFTEQEQLRIEAALASRVAAAPMPVTASPPR